MVLCSLGLNITLVLKDGLSCIRGFSPSCAGEFLKASCWFRMQGMWCWKPFGDGYNYSCELEAIHICTFLMHIFCSSGFCQRAQTVLKPICTNHLPSFIHSFLETQRRNSRSDQGSGLAEFPGVAALLSGCLVFLTNAVSCSVSI